MTLQTTMNKNLLQELRKLTQQLAAAEHDGDEELAEDYRDQIWLLQEQIEEESEIDYSDKHNKNWQ